MSEISLPADDGQWEFLEDTYWYVPTPYLPAPLLLNADPPRIKPLVDQTVWHITEVFNGYVVGEVATNLGGGWVYSTLVGSITPSGSVSFSFTPTDPDSDLTVGAGTMVKVDGQWLFEMQMTTGSGTASVTHWAYMAETKPGDRAWESLPGYPGTGVEEVFDDDPSNDGGRPLTLVFGTNGDDRLSVDAPNPGVLLLGEGGDDTLQGSRKVDGLVGGAGDDLTLGGKGADDLYGQAGADTLKGGQGADLLDGGKGADRLVGGRGADILVGGRDADMLSGDEGADRFVFGNVEDSSASAPDTIADFDRMDIIDVSSIEAGPNLARSDGFEFLGTKVFSGQAGQLRYEVEDGDTFVHGDLDGDAVADLTIVLAGEHLLKASDFAL